MGESSEPGRAQCFGVTAGEVVGARVGLADGGLCVGNANVADGDTPGVADKPGAVDVAPGEGEAVGVGVGAGGGGMIFSQ